MHTSHSSPDANWRLTSLTSADQSLNQNMLLHARINRTDAVCCVCDPCTRHSFDMSIYPVGTFIALKLISLPFVDFIARKNRALRTFPLLGISSSKKKWKVPRRKRHLVPLHFMDIILASVAHESDYWIASVDST